jgi:hypothetical protein
MKKYILPGIIAALAIIAIGTTADTIAQRKIVKRTETTLREERAKAYRERARGDSLQNLLSKAQSVNVDVNVVTGKQKNPRPRKPTR